jgi:hypothetical protein
MALVGSSLVSDDIDQCVECVDGMLQARLKKNRASLIINNAIYKTQRCL